jgi:hypothetical protein
LLCREKTHRKQAEGSCKTTEMSEEAGADGHGSSPCVETKILLQSYA